MIEEQNRKLEEQKRGLEEQNRKLEEQKGELEALLIEPFGKILNIGPKLRKLPMWGSAKVD